MTTIWCDFAFESAHLLPYVEPGHKCGRMHGHSYKLRVSVTAPVVLSTGMVMDFAVIKAAVKPIVAALDHRTLNDIDGLGNPTSENLARWVWDILEGELPGLSCVRINETAGSGCEYRAPR